MKSLLLFMMFVGMSLAAKTANAGSCVIEFSTSIGGYESADFKLVDKDLGYYDCFSMRTAIKNGTCQLNNATNYSFILSSSVGKETFSCRKADPLAFRAGFSINETDKPINRTQVSAKYYSTKQIGFDSAKRNAQNTADFICAAKGRSVFNVSIYSENTRTWYDVTYQSGRATCVGDTASISWGRIYTY